MTFTFDTGMPIALERRKARATQAFRAIVRRGLLPVVPAVVYAEWWRGRTDIREEILAAVIVEDMPAALCRAAGEALGAVNPRGRPPGTSSDRDDARHAVRDRILRLHHSSLGL